MSYKKKFSIFISSTYEDLVPERQAAMGVALECDFIPVGMEQFHARTAGQWEVITKMIDECDFHLLIIGGRYGSVDEIENISYTEKEYNYAKEHNVPVLAFIQKSEAITQDKMDMANQEKLARFRKNVEKGGNTVTYFTNVNSLKYELSASLKNATVEANEDCGWVRFKDVQAIINSKIEEKNEENEQKNQIQEITLLGMQTLLQEFGKNLRKLRMVS